MSGAPLRVLSYTTLFPTPGRPLHGLFVKRRLEHLAKLCHLTVVAPVDALREPRLVLRGPRERTLDGLDVRHPPYAVTPGILKHRDGDFLYLQTRAAARRAARGGIDVVDAHYAYPDGYAARRIAHELGIPYVLSIRGSDVNVLTRYRRRRELIVRSLLDARRVVAVSGALAREAERLGVDPARIDLVPNGVDAERFTAADRRGAREALGLPAGVPLVVSVGRLAAVKGFDLLIDAAARVRAAGPALRVVILGDGPERERLRRRVSDSGLEGAVELRGWTSPEDLPAWYGAADVFALLSSSEGCPNVVLEALACGTPVVASAVGGIPELVRDGENGLLVCERSAEAAAATLARALAAHWDRAAIRGSSGVRGWSQVAEQHLGALRRAAS